MQNKDRIIMHIDFDYFYAQVEEVARPEAKEKPIVVCMYSGRTEDSGAVATSNYFARKFGVKSGMPIIRAKKLLEGEDAVFLPANHELYAEVSQKVMEIVEKYGNKFEQASIDEAFLDITERSQMDYKKAKEIAQQIKNELIQKQKLTCSIGIASNKLIAKIASDFQKPNGLTIVKPEEIDSFLAYLDVDKIPGIGKKTKEFLETIGIHIISDLKNHDPTDIVEKFGKNIGGWLIRASHGEGETEFAVNQEQKQISRIITLKKNSRDLEEFKADLDYLIKDVVNELKERKLVCETIGINAIDEEMQTLTRSRKLQHSTDDLNEIKKIINELYMDLINQTEKEFRRVGVKVEKLQSKVGQKTLGEF